MREVIAWGVICSVLAGGAFGMGNEVAQAQSKLTQNAVLTLDHGWQFRQVTEVPQEPEAGWLQATVPGDIHLDLLANKKIPDPFFRDNESKLQWVEKESWEYRVSFDATPALLARSNVDLVFDGLDAAAQVYLNGIQVLAADNMFRIWRVPVKGHLHTGKNLLRVVFPSPIKAAQEVAARDPWQPKTKTEAKTYIRKAAYEYGWDWGPRFVTSGIWRPVRLEAWDKVRIADFAIRQRDVTKDVAHADAEVEVEAAGAGTARVSVQYTDNGKPVTLSTVTSLHPGRNVIDLPVEIRQPKLWYPAGYGEQPLYQFIAQVSTGGLPAESRKV
jgi:beta-mannosidase